MCVFVCIGRKKDGTSGNDDNNNNLVPSTESIVVPLQVHYADCLRKRGRLIGRKQAEVEVARDKVRDAHQSGFYYYFW